MTSSPRRFSRTTMTASTPRYTAAEINQAKEQVDIVKLIRQKVTLTESGDAFIGICPFHQSTRDASLFVFPQKRRYACHRCGAAGDAVKWLRETQQLSFAEAIEQIRCARKRITAAIDHVNYSQQGK